MRFGWILLNAFKRWCDFDGLIPQPYMVSKIVAAMYFYSSIWQLLLYDVSWKQDVACAEAICVIRCLLAYMVDQLCLDCLSHPKRSLGFGLYGLLGVNKQWVGVQRQEETFVLDAGDVKKD